MQNSGTVSLVAGLAILSGTNDLDHILAGAEISLLATIKNFGPNFANQVAMAISLPSGTNVINAPANCMVTGISLTCQIPNLPPPPDPSNPSTMEIPFTATFSSSGNVAVTVSAIQPDPFPDDDTAVVWVDVRDRVSDLNVSVPVPGPVTASYQPDGTPIAKVAMDVQIYNQGPWRSTLEAIDVFINRAEHVSRIEVPWVSSLFQCSQTTTDSTVHVHCQPDPFEFRTSRTETGTLTFEVDSLGGYRVEVMVVPNEYDPDLSDNKAVSFAAVTDTPEVSVRAIEVTQAVQDWRNGVTLIGGKDTVVRGFVELVPGKTSRVASARLFGERDGNSLGAPLVPVNPNAEATMSDDIVSRRGLLQDSFNFQLPSTWTQGTVELELQVYDELHRRVPVVCNVPDRSSCSVEVAFVPSQQLTVKLFPVVWDNSVDDNNTPNDLTDDTFANVPTASHLLEQALRLRAAFPLTTPQFQVGEFLRYPKLPRINQDIDDDLKKLHDLEEAGNFCGTGNCGELHTRYYGYFVGSATGEKGGTGRAEGKVAGGSIVGFNETSWTGAVARAEDRDGIGYARNRISHELAHTLEVTHTVDPERPLDSKGDQVGACNSKTDPGRLPFPNHAVLTVNANGTPDPGGGQRLPVIGPLDSGPDNEIWGFDTRYVDNDTSRALTPLGHAVVNPRSTWPMMSYCRNGGAQGRWVSAWDYERLIGSISNPSSEGSGDNGGDGDYLLLSGVLSADGSTFEAGNPIEFSGNPYLLYSVGEFRAILRSQSGTELATTNFRAPRGTYDGPEPDEAEQTRLVTVILPKPAEPIAEISILNGDVEISHTVASPTAPSVSILRPVAGDVLDTDSVVFEWFGFDPDGDDLTYAVQYSADDGNTWKPLAIGLAGASYQIDRSSLTASENALISVAVSDGVNTAVDTSGPFRVLNNPPIVQIYQPGSDNVSFRSLQSVTLKALSIDPEEGMLAGDHIAWESDFSGPLGTGNSLVLPLEDLPRRVHLITATATDSAGGSATDTRTLAFGVVGDPNTAWIANFLESMDERAFAAPGLRTAIFARLRSIDRAVEDQKMVPAMRKINNLVRHADGCNSDSATPDRNDWFVDCQAQQQFYRQLDFLRERLTPLSN